MHNRLPPIDAYSVPWYTELMTLVVSKTKQTEQDYRNSTRDEQARHSVTKIMAVNSKIATEVRTAVQYFEQLDELHDQEAINKLISILEEHVATCLRVIEMFKEDDPEGHEEVEAKTKLRMGGIGPSANN